MEAEGVIQPLTSSCGLDSGIDKDEAYKFTPKLGEAEVEGHVPNGENLRQILDVAEIEEGQLLLDAQINGDVTETKTLDSVGVHAETGCRNETEVEEGQFTPESDTDENAVVDDETVTETEGKNIDMPSGNGRATEHEVSNIYAKRDGGSTSGIKRMRTTVDEQQASVHVKFYCLSRQSKRKLEELLREWSEWQAQNCATSHSPNEVPESGEAIYFPALHIGLDKTSAVSFWVENEIRELQNKDFIPMEDESVPLYDRGFSLGLTSADGSSNLEGGLELLDAPRCFNCGSYSHSLKECLKPRDNVAVNNSRKQLKSRLNQTAGMRNATRYYQDSPGGKYKGLRPGVLDVETRRLLGLGEFDPPPWLNRMREIGYPPGYLEPEDENLPSGITIYADEASKEDKEEGEILEAELAEPPKMMSVKFPGINAPIPQNADERLWVAKPSNYDRHRNGESGRSSYSSESISRGHYREHNNRDFKDDDPLGYRRPFRYPVRHGHGDCDFSSSTSHTRESAAIPRSPSSGRSLVDKARNEPLDSEDPLAYRLYSSFSYSSTRRFSERSDGSIDGRGDSPDYSSSRERENKHRHRSRQ